MTPRTAALQAGQTRYVGEPCHAGHTLYLTSTGRCIECQRAYARTWWRTHRAKSRGRAAVRAQWDVP